MGPPPAKRRKRLVVSSSEDEEGDLAPPEGRGDQPRTNTTSNGVDNNRSNAQVLSTRLRSGQAPPSKALRVPPAGPGPPEPEKKTNRQSTTVRNTAKATALDTYFSTDRSLRHGRTSGERAKGPRKATEEDDFIEDDAFDEELRRLFDSRKGIRGESRETPAPSQSHDEKGASRNLPTGSQVFRELGNNVRKRDTGEKAFGSKKQDKRPWADRYGPTSVAELSVHKKKVADVRDWLDAVCYGRSKKV